MYMLVLSFIATDVHVPEESKIQSRLRDGGYMILVELEVCRAHIPRTS